MPRRELEIELHKKLIESEFSFIPRGVHTIRKIYQFVQNEFTELCDDEFKCFDCCLSGGKDPEWRHIVRSVLSIKQRGVRKALGRGNWEFI